MALRNIFRRGPPADTGPPIEPAAQCAAGQTGYSAQCAAPGNEREILAALALDEIERTWKDATVTAQCAVATDAATDVTAHCAARVLALQFRRCLQSRPALINMAVHSSWVKGVYPLFCKAANVTWPPPYKDFAKELAGAMPRKRRWLWKGGKRIRAVTAYCVRDPAAVILDLTVRKRA